MIIVNGFQLLTIITKSSTLDVAAVLDPSLNMDDRHQVLKLLLVTFAVNLVVGWDLSTMGSL